MPYLINALLAINLIVCLLIILLVLMQRPRNEGLGAAFGGGVTEGLFGTQTTHVLARFTRWLGGTFFVLTLVLSLLYARSFQQQTEVEKRLSASAPVAATPAPATPAPTPAVPDGGIVPPTPTSRGTATPPPEGAPVPPSPDAPDATPPPTPPAAEAPAAPATPETPK